MTPRPRQPHAFFLEHVPDHHLESLEVCRGAREGFRVDREHGMTDARFVAGPEVRIVLEAECSTGQSATQHFDDEREHGAFHAADRIETARQRRLRIGRRTAFAIERPAQRYRLAFLRIQHDLAAHDFGE